jgi:hypothetical protein
MAPLLIAETTKEVLGNLRFGEPGLACYERQNVVGKLLMTSWGRTSPAEQASQGFCR